MSKINKQSAILLVESDDDMRRLLTQNLRSKGYRVIVTLNEEDAIERMEGKSDRLDLILLNQVGRSVNEYSNMGRRIHQSLTLLGSIPIVVMAEQYGADMEGRDVKVGDNEYVTYLEDGQQLLDLLHDLCFGN